ncbi:MAG: hypothetical protein LBK66_11660 [Spirochaetaceae bacterium]|jgi:hypothetical protein|nr:hypothetical protein [Spirochaetaceae bacterium]
MKYFAFLILGLSLFLTSCNSNAPGNAISLIAKLPDTSQYAIDGEFVDIGIVYKQVDIEGFKLWNYDKEWCLFNGTSYWVTDKAKLDEIAKSVGISLQSNMDLPFWDEWGGRLLLIGIIMVVVLGVIIWNKIQPKVKTLDPFTSNLNSNNAANLIFDGHYTIKAFNGKNVRWSTTFAKAVSILLPPCECYLNLDFEWSDGNTKHIASNHTTTKCTIEAGKTYFLKSFSNDLYGNNILSTHIVEGVDNNKKDYSSNTGVWKASWVIKRVSKNITKDNAKQFCNEFLAKTQKDGYHFVDERGDNAEALYNEFNKYPVVISTGEVYTYKKGDWLLLISRGDESGIMGSFRRNKT